MASLPVLLKELKLGSFAQHWEALAQKALDEQWLPQQYLAELCEQETAERYQGGVRDNRVGGRITPPVRPHHRAYGTVHGGSSGPLPTAELI